MKITFLTEEWTQSTKGSCSTFMRQMAIELSRLPNTEIGILIPSASPKDKVDAKKYNIKVFEPAAEDCIGYEPVDCLQFPPQVNKWQSHWYFENSCLCVICYSFIDMTGHAEEMQKESQGKRFSARKQVAGNYSLVYFLNMP